MAEQQADGERMPVPLEFCVPGELVSRYATNFVVQHTENEFILSFFEAEAPILLGTPEENLATLQSIGSVKARCVARIIVSPSRMPELIRIMGENYDRYQSRQVGGNG
ncbi:MAG: DUF3467 domain-containing protein [Chloroflexi bacterium]|nr:DUF3467 domain-containing protein [Chloroflexota bacterium]